MKRSILNSNGTGSLTVLNFKLHEKLTPDQILKKLQEVQKGCYINSGFMPLERGLTLKNCYTGGFFFLTLIQENELIDKEEDNAEEQTKFSESCFYNNRYTVSRDHYKNEEQAVVKNSKKYTTFYFDHKMLFIENGNEKTCSKIFSLLKNIGSATNLFSNTLFNRTKFLNHWWNNFKNVDNFHIQLEQPFKFSNKEDEDDCNISITGSHNPDRTVKEVLTAFSEGRNLIKAKIAIPNENNFDEVTFDLINGSFSSLKLRINNTGSSFHDAVSDRANATELIVERISSAVGIFAVHAKEESEYYQRFLTEFQNYVKGEIK